MDVVCQRTSRSGNGQGFLNLLSRESPVETLDAFRYARRPNAEVILIADLELMSEPETSLSDAVTNDSQPQAGDRSVPEQMLSGLLFGLSLPERLVRSAVGITAGTAKEIAEFVVPQAFQTSKSYEVTVRNSLNFLIATVATVSDSKEAAAPSTSAPDVAVANDAATNAGSSAANSSDLAVTDPGRFIAKKAVSNFIDITGLTTLHVSPLWILAIVSDAAYGTKTYLAELASELQKQGLIDDSSTIHKVDDLFAAVQNASGKAASQFDQPPLSLSELKESFNQTRAALNEVDPTLLIPESEIRRYWDDMKQLATRENISLLGVSGAVAMQAVESIRGVSQGTLTGLFVAGKIVNRNIFSHYTSALATIHRNGIWSSVKDSYGPYLEMAWGNFTSSRKSWTEQVLNPAHVTTLWDKVKSMFGGEKSASNEG